MARTPGAGFSLIATKTVKAKDLPMKWLWFKYIPASGAVFFDGDSGVGKSRTVASILYHADGKGFMPDGSMSEMAVTGIIYITGEMDERQLTDVFSAQGWEDDDLEKRLVRVYDVTHPGGGTHSFTLDSDDHLIALERMCKELKANVVVLDPFIEFFIGDENSTHTARRYVRQIQDLGLRIGVLFILIHHWNKNEDLSVRNRMSGSHQLVATVRARLSLFKQKDNPDRKVARLEKSVEESMPDLAYEIDEYGEVQWILDLRPQKSMAGLKDWMRKYLADKQIHAVPEVREAGMALGYSKFQIKHAIDQMRGEIETESLYYGAAKRKGWRLR